MRAIIISWQFDGKWRDYDDIDSLCCWRRAYAIHMFSIQLPIVITEIIHGTPHYIVNTPALLEKYQGAGKPVKLLADVTPSNQSVERVGFFADV